MGGVELLARARALGLAVANRDGRLWIRGPVEHEQLALALIAAKADVLTALGEESAGSNGPAPTGACRHCGGRAFWRRTRGPWVCARCHPAPAADVAVQQAEAVEAGPPTRDGGTLPDDVVRALERFGWEPISVLGAAAVKAGVTSTSNAPRSDRAEP